VNSSSVLASLIEHDLYVRTFQLTYHFRYVLLNRFLISVVQRLRLTLRFLFVFLGHVVSVIRLTRLEFNLESLVLLSLILTVNM